MHEKTTRLKELEATEDSLRNALSQLIPLILSTTKGQQANSSSRNFKILAFITAVLGFLILSIGYCSKSTINRQIEVLTQRDNEYKMLSSYSCAVGRGDLYNSQGQYLPSVDGVNMSDILLQDRCNYHSGRNIDTSDQFDELHDRVNSDNYRSIYESRITYFDGISIEQALSGTELKVEITSDRIIVKAK
jgi:hypothetical protein